MDKTNKPKVTFALIAYNQENFIKQAVEGAFSQTYESLQILLSDDHSTDRTFEIIQEMANEYKGKHVLIINRNSKNIGLGSHINKVMELADGELIIAAAGDDISLPLRAEKLIEKWINCGRPKGVIYSAYQIIDDNGHRIGENTESPPKKVFNKADLIPYVAPSIIGASEMWHRHLFNYFGPLLPDVVSEDICIAFRAYLIDEGTCFNDEILLKRRVGNSNISSKRITSKSYGNHTFMKKLFERNYVNLTQMEKDYLLYKQKNKISEYEQKSIEKKIIVNKKKLQLNIAMVNSNHTEKIREIKNCITYAPTFYFSLKSLTKLLLRPLFILSLKRTMNIRNKNLN